MIYSLILNLKTTGAVTKALPIPPGATIATIDFDGGTTWSTAVVTPQWTIDPNYQTNGDNAWSDETRTLNEDKTHLDRLMIAGKLWMRLRTSTGVAGASRLAKVHVNIAGP